MGPAPKESSEEEGFSAVAREGNPVEVLAKFFSSISPVAFAELSVTFHLFGKPIALPSVAPRDR